MKKYKPGPGWKKLSLAVYENSGYRIHVAGLLRFPNGETHNIYMESINTVKINGGNRKRGLMAFARMCMEFQGAK